MVTTSLVCCNVHTQAFSLGCLPNCSAKELRAVPESCARRLKLSAGQALVQDKAKKQHGHFFSVLGPLLVCITALPTAPFSRIRVLNGAVLQNCSICKGLAAHRLGSVQAQLGTEPRAAGKRPERKIPALCVAPASFRILGDGVATDRDSWFRL
ncbi:unnamed protein product [Effrenium voratum]|nr:unnamed protein product [Effrenium voratum]